MKAKEAILIIGILLVIEGVFIGTDWAQYGIPSIIILGKHLHHWVIGVGMVLVGGLHD